jgi:hypothetical protein
MSRLLSRAISLSIVLSSGCGTDPSLEPREISTSIAKSELTASKPYQETIDLGKGASVLIHTDEGGGGFISATAPATEAARVNGLLAGAQGLSEIYGRLRPGKAVPPAVAAVKPDGKAIQTSTAAAPDESTDEELPTVDSAPATQGAWANFWCQDQIDENNVSGGYYHSYDKCGENKTSGFTHYMYSHRSSFGVVEMYRGAGTFQVWNKWAGAATWNLVTNVNVPQGWQQWHRDWGGSSLVDTKFQLSNVETDGFHYAIQTLKQPMSAMPATLGEGNADGEWVHYACQFVSGNIVAFKWLEGCITKPTSIINGIEQPTFSGATLRCQLWSSANGAAFNNVLRVERMTSTNGAMCNANSLASKDCVLQSCNCNGACPGWKPGL